MNMSPSLHRQVLINKILNASSVARSGGSPAMQRSFMRFLERKSLQELQLILENELQA